MLGVKVKRIQTKNSYTIEQLYDAIKDEKFSAGTPSLTKHGFSTIITFPPLDRHNQVWIIPVTGFKSSSTNKFQVQKSEIAGAGNTAVNMALSDVTDGMTNFIGMIGKHTKTAEKMVDQTVDELNALDL